MAALTLTIANALILTGAIVSAVYGYRVAKFAAVEIWTYKAPYVGSPTRPRRVHPALPLVHHGARLRKV